MDIHCVRSWHGIDHLTPKNTQNINICAHIWCDHWRSLWPQLTLSAYSKHSCIHFPLPSEIITRVRSAKQKGTEFRSHVTSHERKCKVRSFKRGTSKWPGGPSARDAKKKKKEKNRRDQQIWQPTDCSRCEQRLSVKALQNTRWLREIYSRQGTSSVSLLKGQRKTWTA